MYITVDDIEKEISFYYPIDNRELAFITVSMISIGAFLWYSDSKIIYHIIMSIYIGNDLEHRLKSLETENSLLRKYNDYHQVVREIDHMSDLHVDSSFYKQSMKIDNYHKIAEWIDSSIGQSTVIQQLDKKRPTLSSLNRTQNRRRYVNFENDSHFTSSFNLNKPESTIFIAFKMTDITSENQSFFNSIIGNTTGTITAKLITFYRTFSGLGLLISKAQVGSYVAIANGSSSLIP